MRSKNNKKAENLLNLSEVGNFIVQQGEEEKKKSSKKKKGNRNDFNRKSRTRVKIGKPTALKRGGTLSKGKKNGAKVKKKEQIGGWRQRKKKDCCSNGKRGKGIFK